MQLMHCLNEVSDEFGFNPKGDRQSIMAMLKRIKDELLKRRTDGADVCGETGLLTESVCNCKVTDQAATIVEVTKQGNSLVPKALEMPLIQIVEAQKKSRGKSDLSKTQYNMYF